MGQSGFGAEALLYVLTTRPSTVGITDQQIAGRCCRQSGPRSSRPTTRFSEAPSPPIAVLQRELAQVPAFADPSRAHDRDLDRRRHLHQPVAARNAFIAANFGLFMDVATAQGELAPLPAGLSHAQRQAAVNQRASEVLAPLATYLTRTRVIAAVAPNLLLQTDVTALLVEQLTLPAARRRC